ncbi:MAG: hypothetical protein R2856_26565 [Caldilineaceae bacterium]
MNGKLWGVMRVAHINGALVMGDVIDAIGTACPTGIFGKVMGIDLFCCLSPSASGDWQALPMSSLFLVSTLITG